MAYVGQHQMHSGLGGRAGLCMSTEVHFAKPIEIALPPCLFVLDDLEVFV
jgi:hypothetical protein